ncbi:MAG: acyl-CoA/acyl-ACP dehydrogenase [Chloroflexi bacterium]|nr:acyl-CoA/acyl-ACP dehydrogenase [Chloroflexota bacterium]
MDLSLNEQQELLKRTVADFMVHECPKTVLLELDRHETGAPPELWNRIAALGWVGMLIPQQYGGGGNSLTDTAVVYEELGKGPLPGPYFSSGVLGALTVLEAGSEEQKRQILPNVARGSQILSVAAQEPARKWGPGMVQLTATPQNGTLTLNGTKLFIHDAVAATHLVVAVRTQASQNPAQGISLVVVDKSLPGVSARTLPGFLGWVCEVKFENVRVPASAVLGQAGNGWPAFARAMEKAIPILCSYQVGGCEAVFDMSVEYSRTRIQFAQPIGRFQRVQDHIIHLTNHMDAARWTTYEALWKLDSDRPAASSVHLAKAVSSEGYYQACNYAHEVHAGIGISREYGLTLHTKMSRTLYQCLGDPLYHKRRMADALDL